MTILEMQSYTELNKKLKDKNHYNYLTTNGKEYKAVVYEKKEVVADSWEELSAMFDPCGESEVLVENVVAGKRW